MGEVKVCEWAVGPCGVAYEGGWGRGFGNVSVGIYWILTSRVFGGGRVKSVGTRGTAWGIGRLRHMRRYVDGGWAR